ncbi:hypothetical protein IJI55_02675 [Candidatus Saccharibacteria bacterium]|nr:hypothetical protein [Candidatus Saccharibacteria bacterium]
MSSSNSPSNLIFTGLLAYSIASSTIAGGSLGITSSSAYSADSWQSFSTKKTLVTSDYYDNLSCVGVNIFSNDVEDTNDNEVDDEPVIIPTDRRHRQAIIVRSRKYAPSYNIDDIPQEVA